MNQNEINFYQLPELLKFKIEFYSLFNQNLKNAALRF